MYDRLGIDLSEYDTPADKKILLPSGVTFGTIRKSYGMTQDVMCKTNRLEIGAYLKPSIIYHYYHPRKDLVAQAEVFLRDLGPLASNELVMIDLEDYPRKSIFAYRGIFKAEIIPWLEYVALSLKTEPLVYTSPSYMTSYWNGEIGLRKYGLVIAHWRAAYPKTPDPWIPGSWVAWQYTGTYPFARSHYGLRTANAALYVWNKEVV